MASGVKVSDEVKEVYGQVAITKAKVKKLKSAVFKFSDDLKQIVVDSCKDQDDGDDDYDNFVKDLPGNEVRYIVYDVPYTNKEGTEKSELVFISWHPEGCSIKQKMLCASSLNALKQSLNINKNVIEGEVLGEVDYSAVLEKLGGTACAKKH